MEILLMILRPDTPDPSKVPPYGSLFMVTKVWKPWVWYNVELTQVDDGSGWMLEYVQDLIDQYREMM